MRVSSVPRLRPALLGAIALLLLGACDDPAEVAREVVDAKRDCSEEGLRASSEECVRMFERYAGMATEAIHTYIGGVKAMDRALKRLPPANFDTSGLGHPFTIGADGAAPDPRSPRPGDPGEYAPYPDAGGDRAGRWDEPYGVYDSDDAGAFPPDRFGRGEPGDEYPRDGYAPPAAPPTRPTPQPGVLLPPGARLDRPWLRGGEPPLDARDRWDEEPAYEPRR
jgi:hypothetical protein